MTQHSITGEHAVPFVQPVTNEDRFKLRQSRTITYDPGAIQVLVAAACGLQPARGTPAANRWRVEADHIFNHELDLLRAASGASAGQTVTFKPIDENTSAQSSNDSGS